MSSKMKIVEASVQPLRGEEEKFSQAGFDEHIMTPSWRSFRIITHALVLGAPTRSNISPFTVLAYYK